ncbi:hypothetical protein HRR83_004110 [Exophiala dermatitidis]|uniref:Uncharacterized protein n=2 Tax=Exophiala dermatitidis TaxID=5970 RepID=H6BRN2_EXODN|nr:uncharacterized protein HMPREF1120_02926 [Exophiala dermatitidis NIH/UT8656]KAJ4507532.1 hypothetical protein HRR73_007753 [Exophiala dermatitidis]EHY54761.1 hypothetical protein HMPREF1120_02926 [Exophiala dermatitidis NIH/UT8656]KAJ4521585.1 hypothetical protein HRR74_003410 [Exophiala dermatitidis]KAJ4533331.1 hypothetical protein HRR77_008681 [Exophiala dermatitidis]KAJ4545032.1 hypothetical protein HRR76_003062 [Exophiala dermatitidis]
MCAYFTNYYQIGSNATAALSITYDKPGLESSPFLSIHLLSNRHAVLYSQLRLRQPASPADPADYTLTSSLNFQRLPTYYRPHCAIFSHTANAFSEEVTMMICSIPLLG